MKSGDNVDNTIKFRYETSGSTVLIKEQSKWLKLRNKDENSGVGRVCVSQW